MLLQITAWYAVNVVPVMIRAMCWILKGVAGLIGQMFHKEPAEPVAAPPAKVVRVLPLRR